MLQRLEFKLLDKSKYLLDVSRNAYYLIQILQRARNLKDTLTNPISNFALSLKTTDANRTCEVESTVIILSPAKLDEYVLTQ
jgi:hypothetical protein